MNTPIPSPIPDMEDGGSPSRRALLRTLLAGAAVTVAGVHVPADAAGGEGHGALHLSRIDRDILNFALNLEYLEAEFYLFATTGSGLPPELTTGVGDQGPTTGGAQVDFTGEPLLEATAEEITVDEVAHVRLLRSVLGRRAVAKPRINLAALGIGFANTDQFKTLARAFEDVGVSAYGGAAPLIRSRRVVAVAARILATEAYHAGNIRFQVVEEDLDVPAVDGKDQPPTESNFFPTDGDGLAIVRSVSEVLAIVGPFFPNGLNGRIR